MSSSRRIQVPLGGRKYDIVVGSGHLGKLGKEFHRLALGGQAVVLSNPTVLRRYRTRVLSVLKKSGFDARVLAVGDSERSKSLAGLGKVLQGLADLDRPGRRPFLVLLGGGVVGDLGGLAAAVYRRGIPYVQLPTTLLAQVDSSIGGKTAIDLPHGKNLVGVIYQPRLVFIDLKFLRSLPNRQFRSGLAEIVKCGVIRDAELFSRLERVRLSTLRRDADLLAWVIGRAVQVKATLIGADECEKKGRRTLLNFGHTFGHALEAATDYGSAYTHGEAVALGMSVAVEIALRLRRLQAPEARRIRDLVRRMGLPLQAKGVARARIRKAMAHDKKWTRTNRWVLPVGIGRAVVAEGIPERVIRPAVESVLEG